MKKLLVLTLALTLTCCLLACSDADQIEDADGNADVGIITEPTETTPADPADPADPVPCEHVWKDANCAAPKTCILCQETEGEIAVGQHTMTGMTLYYPGSNFSPKEFRDTCTGCGIYSSLVDYDGFFLKYANMTEYLGNFQKGSQPKLADVITAALRSGVNYVYTQGEGDESYIMYYTIKVEDLDAFTTGCLGTTFDYTGVQNLAVLWESTCSYDAANDTIVIKALPAGGGYATWVENLTWTTEDDVTFTVSFCFMTDEDYSWDTVMTVELTDGHYIITQVQ